MGTVKFEIIHQNLEKNTIEIVVDSGDPRGNIEDFRCYMRNAIRNWYDGLGILDLKPSQPSSKKNIFSNIKNFFCR